MELKNVIHYYLGQPCLNLFFPDGHEMRDCEWRLTGIREKSYTKPYGLENSENATWTDSIKPILRKLEDMDTEEKIIYHGKMWRGTDGVHSVIIAKDTPASFHYLLQSGFDLWNLIPSGQAIDATTINK